MQKIFLSCLALAVVLCGPAKAAETCQSLKRIKSTQSVSINIPAPHYDLEKSKEDLNEGMKEHHEEWLKRNGLELVISADNMETLGLNSSGWSISNSFRGTMRPHDKNETPRRSCLYFQNLNVAVLFRTIISIPKEFPQGGCSYNIIHEHEMKHYTTNEAIIRAAAQKLKKELPAIMEKAESVSGPVVMQDEQAAFNEMAEALAAGIHDFMKKETSEELKRQNALIDTPEEYKRDGELVRACDN